MEDMIKIEDLKISTWREAKGSFVIVDYKTVRQQGNDKITELDTAKGELEDVSPDGNILVRHLDNPKIFWIFNIAQVMNSKFSPIKPRGD